jgi:hypothetical protein
MGTPAVRAEVNGNPATAGPLHHLALANYGHFTAMQVRDGRVRGLSLHLARLDGATQELFGTGLTATGCAATSGMRWPATATLRYGSWSSGRTVMPPRPSW